MRKAYSDFGIIMDNDTPIGISLGYDHCAEHEWGIKRISQSLGILGLDENRIGLKSRINTRFKPTNFFYGTKGDYTGLIMKDSYIFEKNEKSVHKIDWTKLPSDLKNYTDIDIDADEPLITAWNESSFGIIIKGPKGKILSELLDGFKSKEIIISFLNFTQNPFANASLTLISKSKLIEFSPESVQLMKDSDNHELARRKIVSKLDLENKMRKAGKYYNDDYDNIMAVSVKLDKDNNPKVWINASNYYGWYTVENIQKFIKDKTGKQINEFK